MSACPLYTPREDLKKKSAWERETRNNCGSCDHWDKERQKCRDEEKLKS